MPGRSVAHDPQRAVEAPPELMATLRVVPSGYRVAVHPRFTGTCLISADVSSLAAFYAAVLDASVRGDDAFATVTTPGANLSIYSAAGMERMAPGSMTGAGSGNFTLEFDVDDVDARQRVRADEHRPRVGNRVGGERLNEHPAGLRFARSLPQPASKVDLHLLDRTDHRVLDGRRRTGGRDERGQHGTHHHSRSPTDPGSEHIGSPNSTAHPT